MKPVAMTRRACITLLGGAAVAWPCAVSAQTPAKVSRLGVLSGGVPVADASPFGAALLRGLAQHGYALGRNLELERRGAEGHTDRLPRLVNELVASKVDALVTVGYPPALAAKQGTRLPVVAINAGDPVSTGLVESLARPGGTVTGNAVLYGELSTKRLEFLKDVVPGLSRVVVLWNAANPANASVWHETQAAAGALGLRLHAQDVQSPQDFEGAFAHTAQAHPDALLVLQDSLMTMHRQHIVEFATRQHLPSVFSSREWVVLGGLMSYGPSLPDRYRRAATYVDKILKGAKPADLPVEQAMKFDLVINLKTAKALGLTIPPIVLFRADEVIQ